MDKANEPDARKDLERRMRDIDDIVRHFNSRPPLTDQTVEEILGYNDKGHFD